MLEAFVAMTEASTFVASSQSTKDLRAKVQFLENIFRNTSMGEVHLLRTRPWMGDAKAG